MANIITAGRIDFTTAAVLGLVALSLSNPAFAQEADEPTATSAEADQVFDNPTYGAQPCVAVGSYETRELTDPESAESAIYVAEVSVENMCGRSVEVRSCIDLAAQVDGSDSVCTTTMLGPWSESGIQRVEAPVAMSDFSVEWRWWSGDGVYGM